MRTSAHATGSEDPRTKPHRALRWRAPRPTRRRKRTPQLLRVVHAAGLATAALPEPEPIDEETAPPTAREPSPFMVEPAPRRPAVFEALCASVEVLAGEDVSCEVEVYVDPASSAAIYRDHQLAARLLSPFLACMPAREGCTPIGTLRVGDRKVRIYERAA
jgi:hypothetical protein